MRSARSAVSAFRRLVLTYSRPHGRHALPWRETRDPYRILVSEVMLQQTQVKRVIPFYAEFTRRFPTARSLARAPLSAVLRLWQGLGYNRRAKMLHDAAKRTMIYHSGQIPTSYEELAALPGVGDYTAKAIRVFAFNEPEVLLETNIRAAFLHHFFPRKHNVTDRALLPYMREVLSKKNPRRWYSALMDYGSHLKTLHLNPSRRSAHHVRQSQFKGSDREIRGAILRALAERPRGGESFAALPFANSRVEAQLGRLAAEGLIEQKRGRYRLPT
ncbi:MAG: A/G-specific adenine glycosylase [Patescibacteria group bacterium]